VGNQTSIDFGDVVTRNKMTIEFNEYLRVKCSESDIIFKDISKQLMLPDGTTDQKYIMDDIHLSQLVMPFILQEFSDLL
jgi:hypothetical protein